MCQFWHVVLSLPPQKLYLAFVSNCKFTSAKTLPQIQFMQNCLVELLSIDPPTSYQHAFVYIRQLAMHLRTSLTSGKKHSVKVIFLTWSSALGQLEVTLMYSFLMCVVPSGCVQLAVHSLLGSVEPHAVSCDSRQPPPTHLPSGSGDAGSCPPPTKCTTLSPQTPHC